MSLRVASWNAGGLRRRRSDEEFLRLAKDLDILAVQETFIHHSTRQVSFPGFLLFKRDAVFSGIGRPVGGLAFLVSHAVSSSFKVEVEDVEECPFECFLLKLSRLPTASPDLPSTFFLLNVYIPSSPAIFDFGCVRSFLEHEFSTRLSLAPFLIFGDFNCHAPGRPPGFRVLRDFLTDEGFKFFPYPELRTPTFVGPKGVSVIDFIFARGFHWDDSRCSILPFDTYGHRLVICEFYFPKFTSVVLHPRTSFRKHVKTVPPTDTFTNARAREGWNGPVEILRKGVTAVFSLFFALISNFLFETRPPELSDEPWARFLSFGELKELRLAKGRVGRLNRNLRVGDSLAELHGAQRDYRALHSSLRRLALGRFADSIHAADGDPTSLWKTVRNFRLDPHAAQGLPVEVLCRHFQCLFNRSGDSISLPFLYEFVPSCPGLDSRFTLSELDRALGELKRNVAPGPSGSGNEVILEFRDVSGFRECLLDLYNACLLGGSVPRAWGKCEMFLLYKGKGDPLLPNSYRAIALLDGFLKVYERLLFHRLSAWASIRDLIPPGQFGFRPRSGTLDAVFVLAKLLERFVFGRKSPLFAALIDFKSAFPSVNRTLLFTKLAKLGISRRFGFALHSLFENNTFSLRFDSGVTQEFQVNTGLREGSVLSPLLFSLFISDMELSVLRPFDSGVNFQYQDFKEGQIPTPGLLYADDLIILARSAFCLRVRLKRLEEYVTRNKLTVNVSKCEVVVFGNNREKFSFRFLKEVLPVRASCKYLGVTFGENSGIKSHLKSLPSRFSTSVTVFFQLMNKLQVGNIKLLSRLVTSLLLSTLYGIEFATDPALASDLSIHFRRGLRSFIGVPSRVSNDFLFMLFPSLSFDLFLAKRKLGFLRRMTGPSDTLASVFFLRDRTDDFPRGLGFSSDLLSFLATLGLPELAFCNDKNDTSRALEEELEKAQLLAWERMRTAKSTSFLCSVFSCPQELYKSLLFASSLNKATLRIFMLMWSGSVVISIFGSHSRVCHLCKQPLTTQHFFGCDFNICGHLSLIVAVRNGNLVEVIRTTVQAYFNYYLRCKPVVLSEDEGLLVDSLDSVERFSSLFPELN